MSVSTTQVHLAYQAKVNITISNTNAEFGLFTNDENESSLVFNVVSSNVKFLNDIKTFQWYVFARDSVVTLSGCTLKESAISLVNSKGVLTSVMSSGLKVISDASSSLFVSDSVIGGMESQSPIVFSGTKNVLETIQVNSTVKVDASTLSIGTIIASKGSFSGTQESSLKVSTCKDSTLEIHIPSFADKVSESFLTVYSNSEIALGDFHSSLVVQSEASVTLSSWNGQIENNGRLDIKDSNCGEVTNKNVLSVSSPLSVTTLNNKGNIFLKGSSLSCNYISLMDGSLLNCDGQSSISSNSVYGEGKIWSNCSMTATRLKGDNGSFVFENTKVSFPVIEGAQVLLNHSHGTICNSSGSSVTLKESGISPCSSGLHISQTTILLDHCNDIVLGKFNAALSSITLNNTHLRINDKAVLVESPLIVTNSHITLFHTSFISSTSSVQVQNTIVLIPEMSSVSFTHS